MQVPESRNSVRVCLLGAALDTGNLGVSALAESSVKCVLNKWPRAEITLLASSRELAEQKLLIAGQEITVKQVPIRFCKNVLLPNHWLILALYVIAFKALPLRFVRRFLAGRNQYLRLLLETDLFADIAGGDSFSDIYGMRRLILGFLVKWLILALRKDLVLLPQTYGPFRARTARWIARYVFKRAKLIYSRDLAGLSYVAQMLEGSPCDGKVRFVPDVAFLLDPRAPDSLDVGGLLDARTKDSVVVGVNVSGLLYRGGYTGKNEFGLKEPYAEIVGDVVEHLMDAENVLLLLVPHVLLSGDETENDVTACQDLLERYSHRYQGRLFMARGKYNHNQIKHIIGMCDFFLGSRMHSCIAALSQRIPALGLAYSKKFKGVFEAIGMGETVIDLRSFDRRQVLDEVLRQFTRRQVLRQRLAETMPQVQCQVRTLFDELVGVTRQEPAQTPQQCVRCDRTDLLDTGTPFVRPGSGR